MEICCENVKIAEYFKTITLRKGEKKEKMKVVICVGSFDDSLFDKECLGHVCMIALQKSLSNHGMEFSCFHVLQRFLSETL